MIETVLIYSKLIRSFYNGLFSALLLYFFYNSLNYQQPIRLSLMIFGSLMTSVIKSKLIQRSIRKRQVNKSLIYALVFYLVPLIIFITCHIMNITEGIAYVIFVIVGFFPVDGEDAIIFQKLEEKYKLDGYSDHQRKNQSKYFRLGYIFQAIGSLCPFIFLTYHVFLVYYVNQTKVKLLMTFCLFLAFINTAFYAFFQLQQLKQPIRKRDNEIQNKQSLIISHNYISNIKMASITEGIYYGLLSAPFMAYYFDLKLNFYQDLIGIMIFAFFLLKGVGYEVMSKYSDYKHVFRYWSLLSNCLLVVAALIPVAKISVISFLLAFPVWNYSKVFREISMLKGNSYRKIKGLQNIKYWEQLGNAIGVLISSFFFSILSTKYYFGYPVFLCGLLGIVKIFIIQPLIEFKINNTQFTAQFQLQTPTKQIIQQKQPIKTEQILQPENLIKLHKKSYFVYVFLGTICFIINGFQIYNTYFGNMGISLTTRGDKILTPSKLMIVNQSIAHYLVRQNITDVKLVYCNQLCVENYKRLQTNYYQYLKYDSSNPQWLYFSHLPYFSTQQQVVDKIQNVLMQYPKVKGFSLIWSNPLQYNKMPSFIDQYLLKMPQKYGFYYSQMPSLNLRGTQDKILMIFTQTKRIKSQLPSFIKQQPPNNILAIQVTFKLLTHYRYIREYILYHLNMGVDKFFIYDNNRNPNDQQYYQEYHQVNRFLKKCMDESIDGQYAILEEILEEFYDHIIYIPWKIGQLHPQGQAHLHYRCYFQNIVKFTSFTDMDQYLFSPTGKYIPDTLQSLLQQHQATAILISSRSFKTRICMHNQLSIEQYRFLHLPKDRLTVKTIALTRLLVDHSIHDKSVKNGRYAYLMDDKPDIIMYHYTVYGVDYDNSDVKKYDWDYSLKPLVQGMKEACRGKCSDKIGFTCSDQEYEIAKIDFCKEPK